MHHAAVNAELARLRHSHAVAAAERRDVPEAESPDPSDTAFFDTLLRLATKLLPELHSPLPPSTPVHHSA